MPPSRLNQSLLKPFEALAVPGMYLVYKYNQFKRQQQENSRRKVAEKELAHLNSKIVSKSDLAFSVTSCLDLQRRLVEVMHAVMGSKGVCEDQC